MLLHPERYFIPDNSTPLWSECPPDRGVWDVLEQFLRDLEHCQDANAQRERLLQAIRASLQADAVFQYSAQPGTPVEVTADRPLPTAWCRALAEQQLAALPAHRTSHSYLGRVQGFVLEPQLKPHSTALVRLSKTRGQWIIAVNFDTQRLFRADDLKIMLLIRRIFLEQRRQTETQKKLTDAVLGVVRGLNEAICAKSPFTCGHSERVARMAMCLGRQMGLAPAMLSDLYLAGLLHDVGKIGIRDTVLQKQGPLTEEEESHIREHPVIGDGIVAKIEPLTHLRPGVRNHHERFDGQGYPDRLAGEAIPLVARILAVVDACDAMMSPRPYRAGLPTAQVDAIMADGAGTQWDPLLIEHFMVCRRQLYSIYEKGIGDSVLQAVEEVVRAGSPE